MKTKTTKDFHVEWYWQKYVIALLKTYLHPYPTKKKKNYYLPIHTFKFFHLTFIFVAMPKKDIIKNYTINNTAFKC